jgi:PAS domain-containing protein
VNDREIHLITLLRDPELESELLSRLEKSLSIVNIHCENDDEAISQIMSSPCDAFLCHFISVIDIAMLDRVKQLNPYLSVILIVDKLPPEIPPEVLDSVDGFILRYELDSSPDRLRNILKRTKRWKSAYQHMQSHVDEFLSIFNCLDVGIYIVDPQNYTILAANSSAIRILGQNPVGKRCYEVLLKDQAGGPCSHCDNELLSRGILQYGARPWEFKNAGNDRWYRCVSKIISWSENKFAKMEVILDITDAKRMEREMNVLRVFKEKIRTLSHCGVIEFDKKGKIVYTNGTSRALLERSEDELHGEFVWKFLDEAGKEAWFNIVEEVSPKDSESIECTMLSRDKRVEVSMDIIFNRDIKGSLIEGILFIVEKKAKGIVRFY